MAAPLVGARPGKFDGVEWVGGSHIDAVQGEETIRSSSVPILWADFRSRTPSTLYRRWHARLETLLERGAEGEPARKRPFGDTRDHFAAVAHATSPGPPRRCCLPGVGESLSRDGDVARLRRTHRLGRRDAMSAVGRATTARVSK